MLLLLLSGCEYPLRPNSYQGTFLRYIQEKAVSTQVDVKISFQSKKKGEIRVTERRGGVLEVFALRKRKDKDFDILIPNRSTPIRIRYEESCYYGNDEYQIKLCFDKTRFKLQVADLKTGSTVMKLWGGTYHYVDYGEIEEPKDLTLSQAVDQALKTNFDLHIQYERAYQAKQMVKSAYLHILPHLNVGTIVWNYTTDPMTLPISLAATSGDVAPFILPNRWIQASKSRHLKKAQYATFNQVKAELVEGVESLAYVYERDLRIFRVYQKVLSRLGSIDEETLIKASQSDGAMRAHKQVLWMKRDIDVQVEKVKRTLADDLRAISRILGKHAKAVKDLSIGREETPIFDAPYLDEEDISRIAVDQSYNIEHFNQLLKAIKKEKVEMFFSFLDPQANPNWNLGFALIPQYKIEASRYHEIKAERLKMKAAIEDLAHNAVQDYNLSREGYRSLITNLQDYTKELDTFDIEKDDLVDRIKHFLSTAIDVETTLAQFRIARAKIDRLRHSGYQSRLFPGSEFEEEELLANNHLK